MKDRVFIMNILIFRLGSKMDLVISNKKLFTSFYDLSTLLNYFLKLKKFSNNKHLCPKDLFLREYLYFIEIVTSRYLSVSLFPA